MSVSGEGFLRIVGLVKAFERGARVLDGVDLSVDRGEMIALLGPSGCGKTTLLRAIAGLGAPDAGSIALDGASLDGVAPARRGVGVVFQNYALFPHMSVADNVAYGLRMRRTARSEIQARVAETLALVGLADFGSRRPKTLSGGQQQRVALARALVIRPALLLLDEPMSGLDPQLREGLRFELRRVQRQLGITTVMVTHDQADAFSICDRVALMSSGRILQYGPAQALHDAPASLEAALAFGRANRLDALIERPGRLRAGAVSLESSTKDLATGPAVALIRPHRIRLGSVAKVSAAANAVDGVVEAVHGSGDLLHVRVATPDLVLKVCQPVGAAFSGWSVGDPVRCAWDAEAVMVFPSS